MIGSQNWSNDGISVNRDASLIFYDDKLALYFRNIFLHDWEKLAHYNIGLEAFSLELATTGGGCLTPGPHINPLNYSILHLFSFFLFS